MGKLVLRDASITVDGVDLSDHAASVTITSEFDLVESTAFGALYKSNLLGMGDASIEIEFHQDFAAASVDATLWPLHQSGETFAVTVTPAAGVVSATNPSYTLPEAVLPSFSPLAGEVGELSTTTVTFQNAGQQGIVKDTTP